MAEETERQELKAIAMSIWRRGGMDTLVKVVPMGMRLDPGRNVGYCTTFKYVVGRTPAEMEAILGFRGGSKLANGAEIYRVDPLPSLQQFELRGYSQTPAGASTGDETYVPQPDYPPGQGVPQWELVRYPQSSLMWIAAVRTWERFSYPVADLPCGLAQFH